MEELLIVLTNPFHIIDIHTGIEQLVAENPVPMNFRIFRFKQQFSPSVIDPNPVYCSRTIIANHKFVVKTIGIRSEGIGCIKSSINTAIVHFNAYPIRRNTTQPVFNPNGVFRSGRRNQCPFRAVRANPLTVYLPPIQERSVADTIANQRNGLAR